MRLLNDLIAVHIVVWSQGSNSAVAVMAVMAEMTHYWHHCCLSALSLQSLQYFNRHINSDLKSWVKFMVSMTNFLCMARLDSRWLGSDPR